MNFPPNRFKQALREGKPLIGLWSSLCSNIAAEAISGSGFDWTLIDMEHAPNELPIMITQLQALSNSSTVPVVRPAWNDMVLIKRILDAGAHNLLVPYVQTVEEALVKWGFRYVTREDWGRLRRLFQSAFVFKLVGAGIGGYFLLGQLSQSQKDVAKAQVKGPLTDACKTYFIRNNSWPPSLACMSGAGAAMSGAATFANPA